MTVSRARTYVKAHHSMNRTLVGGFEGWTGLVRKNQLLATVARCFDINAPVEASDLGKRRRQNVMNIVSQPLKNVFLEASKVSPRQLICPQGMRLHI